MSDKSKQLAVLLGIEPKRIYRDAETQLYKLAEKHNSKITYDENSDNYFIEIYPNFEKPENFVKLLEFIFLMGDFCCGIKKQDNKTFVSVFIDYFLAELEEALTQEWNKEAFLKAKHQAQKVDWSY